MRVKRVDIDVPDGYRPCIRPKSESSDSEIHFSVPDNFRDQSINEQLDSILTLLNDHSFVINWKMDMLNHDGSSKFLLGLMQDKFAFSNLDYDDDGPVDMAIVSIRVKDIMLFSKRVTSPSKSNV